MTMAQIIVDGPSGPMSLPFEGIEHDLEYSIDRHIKWIDAIGAPPRGLSLLDGSTVQTGQWDTVDATFTVWTGKDNAQGMEMLPPYMNGYKFDLWLPGRADTQAFPGFGTWDAYNGVWKLVNLTPVEPVSPYGRKAPIMDLWGYKFKVHFSASGGGTNLNELNGQGGLDGRGSALSFLGTKFIAHQIQDWSRSAIPVPYANPSQGTTQYTGAHHGQRRDGGIAFDHLSSSEAQIVIDWFRKTRNQPFPYSTDQPFGPNQPNNVQALARELTVNRGAGWWWDLKLETTLYI